MPSQLADTMRLHRETQLAHLRRGGGPFSRFMPDTWADVVAKTATIVDIGAATDRTIDEVGADPLRSAQGKTAASDEAYRTAFAQRDLFAQANIAPLDAREAALAARLDAAASTETVTEMECQQIIQQIIDQRLSTLEIETLYRVSALKVRLALETGGLLLTRATPDALPTFVPFVNPDVVREQRLARARARDPQTAGEIAALQAIANTYRSLLATLTTAIVQAAPHLREQPLVTV